MKSIRKLRLNPLAFIYIKNTFKNTIITVTNADHETLFQKSSRSYKSTLKQKNNPYVLQKLTFQIIQLLKYLKYKRLYVFMNGLGAGRYNIIKHLIKHFKILLIYDKTNIPFNGCRLKKPKRK